MIVDGCAVSAQCWDPRVASVRRRVITVHEQVMAVRERVMAVRERVHG